MNRILVIGCPGSGKSTLARQLGDRFGLTVVHLDRLWWQPGWQSISQEEFDTRLERALALDSWIIDGNYSRTMQQRISRCDTVIYLDFNRWSCLLGVFQRMVKNRGKTRPDMATGCPERLDWEFLRYIWNFNRENRVQISTWLAQAKHAKIFTLRSRRDVKNFLDSL